MSAAEFGLWMAFEQLEPFGPLADDYRAGTIAASVVNVNLRKGAQPRVASDFMPALALALREPEETETVEPTPEQHASFMDAMFGFK
jgi:hypothetical protein